MMPRNISPEQQFRSNDALSVWTEELASAIPYPSRQFDQRADTNRSLPSDVIIHPRSSLYCNLTPSGWIAIDAYSPDIERVEEGCVVFVSSSCDNTVRQIIVSRENFTPALEGFEEAIMDLPAGYNIYDSAEPIEVGRQKIDARQLTELGRIILSARTGSVYSPNAEFIRLT